MGVDLSAQQRQKITFPVLWLVFKCEKWSEGGFSEKRATPLSSYHHSAYEYWSASSRLTSAPWCYHLPLLEDNTQQCRLAELEKKFPINQEFSGKEFQFNLPKEEASCTSLKHVRVQGFKGLWHRLTASGQGQLLSALVLGVGQGLTC